MCTTGDSLCVPIGELLYREVPLTRFCVSYFLNSGCCSMHSDNLPVKQFPQSNIAVYNISYLQPCVFVCF